MFMGKKDVGIFESVDGGCDVWSSKSSADHLVVMVNGIIGSATDWQYAAEQFVKEIPDKVFVHCSERNVSNLTLDGVDVMGERLAEEVLEVIQSKPNLRKISFVAHSVGGLVARYVIGRLYRSSVTEPLEDSCNRENKEDSMGTLGGLEAMNFITVATPHLGSRGNKQVPFLFGVTALEIAARYIINVIFRRTGQHLFLTDHDEGKAPLLKRMVEDYDGYYFISALCTFKRRVLYSNVRYDYIVGWRTSCIRRDNELPTWEDAIIEKYPHVVYEEHCTACDAEQSDLVEDTDCDKIEEELVTALSRMSWEKVGVDFPTQKFTAHSVIQVKDPKAHVEGVDVIQHMIDHFLV
ncbi:PREDICTED: putative lipase YOR059C isoform X2 [Lupinus angustifolius]|uniref:putative lipase YOR059C isoform X2 n=1 Tax=Lupinus angustifolius TaxID=3871 RepID=UPI00092EF322|nr:PREDICTED: putative lipase YOR059C isoform X2 [Lupinus angustifolius]